MKQLLLGRVWSLGVVSVFVTQPVWAQVAPVTAVRLNPTAKGLEITLQTTGSFAEVFTSSSGNSLITDIPNTQLRLPGGQAFRQDNPTQDITSVTVTNLNPNQIRVTVTGKTGAPTAEVTQSPQGLILSLITPAAPQPPAREAPTETDETGQETEPPATPAPEAEAEELPETQAGEEPFDLVISAERQEDNYQVDRATAATRFEAPLRDIPRSVQVVPQQVIEDQRAIRLEDVLRNVSGVSRDNTFGGTADGFSIRGFAADIFRNGFPDVPGTSSFSSVRETANLERIEVLKGPSSILYGSLSPGGIINLVTKQPLEEPFYNGELSIGSFSLYRPSIDLSGPVASDQSLLYRLNAVYENSSSFRDFTQIERFFIAPTLTWKISDQTDLTLELDYLNDERPFDRGLVAIGDQVADIPIGRRLGEPSDVRRVEDLGVGYRLEHQFNENWTLRNAFRSILSDNFTRRFEPRSLDEETGILEREFRIVDGNRESYALQTELLGKFATGSVEHQTLVGVDLSRITAAETGFRERPAAPINIFNPVYGAPIPDAPLSFDTENQSNRLGIYLQDLVSLTDNLKLLVGGRFDTVDQESTDLLEATTATQDDTAFSPNVGLVYQPIEPISLYTSFSRSFQPNTATRADLSFLEPERGTQYEVGVKGEFLEGRLSSTLAFYNLTRSNVGTVDPANPDFFLPVGEQRSRGVELDIAGEIRPGWNIIAGYAYTDAIVTEGDEFTPTGNQLPNIPQHSASLWTTYEIQGGDFQGLGFGAGLFFVGDRQGDFANSFTLPSYLRTDAAIYYRRDNWKAAINVRNLFDIRYFESSAFERERITPGAPLTVVGTVSVEF